MPSGPFLSASGIEMSAGDEGPKRKGEGSRPGTALNPEGPGTLALWTIDASAKRADAGCRAGAPKYRWIVYSRQRCHMMSSVKGPQWHYSLMKTRPITGSLLLMPWDMWVCELCGWAQTVYRIATVKARGVVFKPEQGEWVPSWLIQY